MHTTWLTIWLIYSAAFWLTSLVLPGFKVDGIVGALVSSAIFGVLNWLLGTILFWALGLATIGIGFVLAFLTHWVVNAILLKFAASLSSRLSIRSFGSAFLAGLLISVLATLGKALLLAPHAGAHRIWV